MNENLYNLPPGGALNIQAFQRAMDTAGFAVSYKPFWFLAIMDLLQKEHDAIGDGGIRLKTNGIARRMLVLAWVPSVSYHLSFGSSDKLGESVRKIADSVKPDRTVGSYDEIQRIVDSACDKYPGLAGGLLKYVPFRFLSSFYRDELKGVKDSSRNYIIRDLSSADNSLYNIVSDSEIKITADWCRYLTRNSQILTGWAKYSLTRCFEKRNPNVLAIASKLDLAGERNLTAQRKLWTAFLSDNRIVDFITGEQVRDDFHLDHYIPWAFVQHNQLWNLSPLSPESNLKKSDLLPDWKKTFGSFSETQHSFYSFFINNNKDKLLEDYLSVFNSISPFPKSEFVQSMEKHIQPLWQIAKNMGW
ncbi:MAG: hypothetical protein JXK07_07910 [Spirochaetes bacterium]|nr:hypothetical protein [Spirochaetota bacterium]MBN2772245.1 hypothetical protein [Spirochaetota bacterium]